MTSIERTAYPRFTRAPSVKELREIYTPTPTDVAFVASKARGPAQKFALMILLKVYQRLHYFPDPQSIPRAVIDHIRSVMKLPDDVVPDISPATLYRYYVTLREHLELDSRGKHARHVAVQAMHQAAQVMESPADLVKDTPQSATLTHLDDWLSRLTWLQSWGTMDSFLEGVRSTKATHLAQEARSLYPSDLLGFSAPRRLTLLVCLLHQATVSTRDEIIQMVLKRMSKLTEKAKQELERLREEERAITEHLVEVLADVVQVSADAKDAAERGAEVHAVLDREGGPEKLLEQCEQVSAHHGDRYQPFVKKFYGSHRKALFRVIKTLELRSTTADQALIEAMQFIIAHEHSPKQYLEACVFSCLADELKTGDICCLGSEQFADYRDQLLPWSECEPKVAAYCHQLSLPTTATGLVNHLRTWLTEIAAEVDRTRPENQALMINEKGEPSLKRLTLFAYGTNLGPHQMARHLRGTLTADQIAHINRRHITAEELDAALRDVKNCFNRYMLPRFWGEEKRAAADGTQYELAEENLLAEKHIRYGGFGRIAYHHVSDMYILLFSRFIGCGVHEAIYLLDGLMRNRSDIKPSVIHADTHGQNIPVFGLSFLLGIELMPRIRNWKGLKFYRPSKEVIYEHIDSLFHDNVIDWNLIETHWQDLFQVVISIQEGKVLPSMLLRKLGTSSHKNRLYQAFYALGCVVRTVFLLTMISDVKLREVIHRATNKVEQYNALEDWVRFAKGGVIYEHAFDEQEKQVKYTGLLTSCVIFGQHG